MTEKRFYKTASEIEDYRVYDDEKEDAYFVSCDEHTIDCLVELLNEFHEENRKLKQELQKIYEIATLKKARDIVDKVYDDLLYETSEKSDYARNKVLECLEKLDEFGDDLE